MERLDFDLSFRWFVGLGIDDAVWNHSKFSKNRDRLLAGDIAVRFLLATLEQSRVKRLLSGDHFLVDGTLIEARAVQRSMLVVAGESGMSHIVWKRRPTIGYGIPSAWIL